MKKLSSLFMALPLVAILMFSTFVFAGAGDIVIEGKYVEVPSNGMFYSASYFPDYNEADQGITGDGKSAKAYIDTISADSATLVFRHNSGGATTIYTFSTSETIPSNINIIIEKGVLFSISNTKILTINSPPEIGLCHVFTGAGSVVFGKDAVKEFSPSWWGMVGDGTTDNTTTFNACLTAASGKGRIVLKKAAAAYKVGEILIPSNTDLYIEPGTVIEANDNLPIGTKLLSMISRENINIEAYGAIVQMIVADYAGDSNEHRHIFNIENCDNINIEGVTAKEAGGDGFYIRGVSPWTGASAYSSNITLKNVVVDGARRIGITIISGKHINIINPEIKNGNSTGVAGLAGDGIHFEPNHDTELFQAINIVNPWTHDNKGHGIKFTLGTLEGSTKPISITIDNHISYNDGIGIALRGGDGSGGGMPGQIVFNNPLWELSGICGAEIKNYPVTYPSIIFNNPYILNPNEDDNSSSIFGSAIGLYRPVGDASTVDIGNLHVYSPTIIDTRSPHQMYSYIYAYNNNDTTKISNCSFIDPVVLSGKLNRDAYWGSSGVISDKYSQMLYDTGPANVTINPTRYYSLIHNGSETSNILGTVTLGDILAGYPDVAVEVRLGNGINKGMKITPDAGDTIIPLGVTAGQSIQSVYEASKIILKRVDADTWYIANQVGNWEVSPETMTAVGATVICVRGLTNIDTTAGVMAGLTLSSGIDIGDIKRITMTTDGGDATLTVANHSTSSPEVFTFNDAGDKLVLQWTGYVWITLYNSGVTV